MNEGLEISPFAYLYTIRSSLLPTGLIELLVRRKDDIANKEKNEPEEGELAKDETLSECPWVA